MAGFLNLARRHRITATAADSVAWCSIANDIGPRLEDVLQVPSWFYAVVGQEHYERLFNLDVAGRHQWGTLLLPKARTPDWLTSWARLEYAERGESYAAVVAGQMRTVVEQLEGIATMRAMFALSWGRRRHAVVAVLVGGWRD